jgi:hypothetical protein
MDHKIQVKFDYGGIDIYLSQHCVKIWLSGTLNIIRKPKKSVFSKRKRTITQER